jgi:HTH-type transcriptional regulator/antitoxin HigA
MKPLATKSRRPGKKRTAGRPSPSYLSLIERFPLRPLRSEPDYEAAAAILDGLAVRPEGSLDAGEQDYLDTLTLLVEAYDREHEELNRHADDLSMLKYLLQESGMTQADFGRLLGNRALASLILRGHRQLSKAHIRKLANHFKLSPALFFCERMSVCKQPMIIPVRAGGASAF